MSRKKTLAYKFPSIHRYNTILTSHSSKIIIVHGKSENKRFNYWYTIHM